MRMRIENVAKNASKCPPIFKISVQYGVDESNGDVRSLMEADKEQFVRMRSTNLAKETAQNDWRDVVRPSSCKCIRNCHLF